MQKSEFQALVRRRGGELYREMPWRSDTRPYYVTVSEIMLQQTQVNRVIPKFDAFIKAFPSAESLAQASLGDVLRQWQGLGYNRRAKYLHDTAKMILQEFGGKFPDNEQDLLKLPGIGQNTAGAIMAYSYNQPAIFIETNIRTVYIHHFFADDNQVDDASIKVKLVNTVDPANPRKWYWSLMDYGSWLKLNGTRNNSLSKHYQKQSVLAGSMRQTRGQIIKALASEGALSESALSRHVIADERFQPALSALRAEGLVELSGAKLHLTK